MRRMTVPFQALRAIPGNASTGATAAWTAFSAPAAAAAIPVARPGTEMAPMTWVGTCKNPADGRDYIIAYNDCCGKSTCNRCMCNRNEGDLPNYFPAKSNDINWCMGSSNNVYHCTTTILLGTGDQVTATVAWVRQSATEK